MNVRLLNNIINTWAVLFLTSIGCVFGQEFDLQQVINHAQRFSYEAKAARTAFENAKRNYELQRINRYPSIKLSSTLPDFTRSIVPVTQDDGSELFREVSRASGRAEIGITQPIRWTGSQLFVKSSLQRIENFAPVQQGSFNATPFQIGFSQPIFNFNAMRWEDQMALLKWKEAQRKYLEAMEQTSIMAVERYFEYLVAQVATDIAKKSFENSDTLFKIGQGRYNLGKIAESELLQLELGFMNNDQARQQAVINAEVAASRLKLFLNIDQHQEVNLLFPKNIPVLIVDDSLALQEAKANNSFYINRMITLQQGKLDRQRIKANNGLNANLYASFGFTQQSDNIEGLYENAQNQQYLSLGFEVPILDWGKAKKQLAIADANYELLKENYTREHFRFEQEVLLHVKQFKMNNKRLEMAKKADEIAQKRFEVTYNRYKIGKIGILDLTMAQQSQEEAKRGYLNALRTYWMDYYKLRLLTLYDFKQNTKIAID